MARWLITFPSVYHAFRAERLLKQQQLFVEMVPVPRSLSGSCEGMAAEIAAPQMQQAVELLKAKEVEMRHEGIKVDD